MTMTHEEVEPIEEALANGTAVAIPLTKGKVAYVSVHRYEEVAGGPAWTALDVTGGDGRFYAVRTRNGRMEYMHRLLLGLTDRSQVADHMNGDSLDNRDANLRVATPHENCGNAKTRTDNSSGFKGVDRAGRRWRARIQTTIDGRGGHTVYRSYHDTAEQAARAYDVAARDYFGEFARLNFPRPGERGLDGNVRSHA